MPYAHYLTQLYDDILFPSEYFTFPTSETIKKKEALDKKFFFVTILILYLVLLFHKSKDHIPQ